MQQITKYLSSVHAVTVLILTCMCTQCVLATDWEGTDGSGPWWGGSAGNPNWNTGIQPNGVDATAVFNSSEATFTTAQWSPGTKTLGQLTFNSTQSYTIGDGPATNLTLDSSSGTAGIDMLSGSANQRVTANLTLSDSLIINQNSVVGDLTLSGNRTANFGVRPTKTGAGRVILTGDALDGGNNGFVFQDGVVQVATQDNLSTGASSANYRRFYNFTGGGLHFTDDGVVGGWRHAWFETANTSFIEVDAGKTVNWDSRFHGDQWFTKRGDGTLSYNNTTQDGNANNDFRGRTRVEGGTLDLTAGVIYRNEAAYLASNPFVAVNNGSTLRVAGFGRGDDQSLGYLYFGNSYLRLNNGTIEFTTSTNSNRSFNAASGDSTLKVLDNLAVSLGYGSGAQQTIQGTGNLALDVGTKSTLTLGKQYDGARTLTKTGAGTARLTRPNGYNGDTFVNGGTLDLTSGGIYRNFTAYTAVPGATVTVDNGATLRVAGFNRGNAESLGWMWIGNNYLTLDDATLEFTTNTTSPRSFSAGAGGGTLKVNDNRSVTLQYGTNAGQQNIGGTGDLTLDVGSNSTLVVDKHFNGARNLTKTGAGTAELNQNNSFSGKLTISAGTLTIGGVGAISQASEINIGSPGTLDLNGNAYTLQAGQTLSGTGSVSGGPFTIGSGAILSPGNSPGVLTLDAGGGAVTWAGVGSIYNWQVLDAAGTNPLGDDWDFIEVTNGDMDLSTLAANSVTINILGIDNADDAAIPANLDYSVAGTQTDFDILSATDITGYERGDFQLIVGSPLASIGTFDLDLSPDGSTLFLTFTSTVPEPGTWALLLTLSCGLFASAYRHRRKERDQ